MTSRWDHETTRARLARLSIPNRPGECITWAGGHDRAGYAKISVGLEKKLAHRVAYELLVGTIPRDERYELHHVCGNGDDILDTPGGPA